MTLTPFFSDGSDVQSLAEHPSAPLLRFISPGDGLHHSIPSTTGAMSVYDKTLTVVYSRFGNFVGRGIEDGLAHSRLFGQIKGADLVLTHTELVGLVISRWVTNGERAESAPSLFPADAEPVKSAASLLIEDAELVLLAFFH
jgi:hypothetical protein